MRKIFIAVFVIMAINISFSSSKSICGAEDNRIRSYNNKMFRIRNTLDYQSACSATLTSDSCAITAGHCSYHYRFAEFNMPDSDEKGQINVAEKEDVYEVDRDTIVFKNNYRNDWGVFKLKPNKLTGKLPGKLYGHYKVDLAGEHLDTNNLAITGNGTSDTKHLNFVQKTHSGELYKIEDFRVRYTVDTTNGNSGSSVINKDDDIIIAIHTNGGCSATHGSNYGTLISANEELKAAIRSCLESDK